MGCGGGSDTEDVIVGYRYFVGVHMLLTQGPIDKFTQIWVGEDFKVWEGESGAGTIYIDELELFGGDEKGGGVQGNCYLKLGTAGQGRDGYLQGQLAGDCPAFRWLSGAVLDSMYIGTSTYPKPWAFTCRRQLTGWHGGNIWYSSKAAIGQDMNPAHIIYEVLTSDTFGKGLSAVYIDDASFKAAADTLYDEGFGLSYLWGSDMEPDDFIREVLTTINGTIYQDMATGKYQMALARDDYVVGDLDLYDETDIMAIEDFKRPALGEVPNWVVLKYHDRAVNKSRSITVHDLAMIDRQGVIIPVTHTYAGVCKNGLATKLAGRQLEQYSSLLATMTIKGNRNFADIKPNDMIKMSWPYLGIVELPIRVLAVDYGELAKGIVSLSCAEDVFAAGQGIYADVEDTLWQEPWSDPADATLRRTYELPYGGIIDSGLYTQEDVDANDPQTDGVLGVMIAKPTIDSIDYKLLYKETAASSTTYSRGYVPFTPTGVIENTGGLAQDVESSVISVGQQIDLTSVENDSLCLIDNEILKITNVDLVNVEITVLRGVYDTVPEVHTVGTRIWFFQIVVRITRLFPISTTPVITPLPRTLRGTLAEGDATTTPATDVMNKRAVRPYSAQNFKINGSSYPASFTGQPALTWNHRNRKYSLGVIVTANQGWYGELEPGGYYELDIYDENDSLIQTVTPITAAGYTLTELDERDWSGLDSGDPLNTSLRFVLRTERQDSTAVIYESWQSIDFTVARV